MTARSAKPVPVLGFHHVDDHLDDYTSVTAGMFAQLVERLAERFRFSTLTDALARPQEDEGAPPIVLTFDDGYANILAPLLQGASRHGLVGTVYLIAHHLGGPNSWNRKCAYWSEHLDPRRMRELTGASFDIGSHTLGHHRLPKLPDGMLEAELAESRAILEQEFGQPVETLAYPYGFNDERVRAAAARHYRWALSTTTKPGGTDPAEHGHALRRLMITRSMTCSEVIDGIEKMWGDDDRS